MSSSRKDVEAEQEMLRLRQARRDDPRMTRTNEGTARKPFWRITCSGCKTCLVVGEDVDMALALAKTNATARPCCDLWRVFPEES